MTPLSSCDHDECSLAECKVLYDSEVESVHRRMQVLRGIWDGKGVKEIGADLGISPKTVEWHRQNLYRLFGVSDSISLCKRAIKRGLLKL